MSKLLFLSHIHEEKALALLFKSALEEEFSGFVEVFVSSDGTSIPAGANFLKKIEDGLADCVAGIYLISPFSVKRNWVNFELGAVWMRSVLNVRQGLGEIPALPFCHSGASPGNLPSPLNNLNGVEANISARLEFAFASIQAAVGGKGRLRTDFDALASSVRAFEAKYILEENMERALSLFFPTSELPSLFAHAEANHSEFIMMNNIKITETRLRKLEDLLDSNLIGVLEVKRNGMYSERDQDGHHVSGIFIDVKVSREALLSCKSQLLK